MYTFQKRFQITFQSSQKLGKFAKSIGLRSRKEKKIAIAFAWGGNHSNSRRRERFPLQPGRNFDKTSRATVIIYHFIQHFSDMLKVYDKKKFCLDGLPQVWTLGRRKSQLFARKRTDRNYLNMRLPETLKIIRTLDWSWITNSFFIWTQQTKPFCLKKI